MVSRRVFFIAAAVLFGAALQSSADGPGEGHPNDLQLPVQIAGEGASVSRIEVREGFGYIYRGSQALGEMRLHGLALSATKEDAWLFSKGLWLDIGYEEQRKSVLCCWELFQHLPSIPAQTELLWYHIHPLKSDPTGIHPPSVEDILALARMQYLCIHSYDLRGKVFDGCGVWTVDLTDAVQHRLYPVDAAGQQPASESLDPRDVAALRNAPKRRQEVAILAFYLEHERRARDILGSPIQDRDTAIRRYLLSMKEIGVLLEYAELSE